MNRITLDQLIKYATESKIWVLAVQEPYAINEASTGNLYVPRESRYTALKLLDRLQLRLNQKGLFDRYESELMVFLKEGFAEKVGDMNGYFIPHREVERPEAESTKFRIVLNAPAGMESLNDLLWKGEVKGLNVLPHLIRVRTLKFLTSIDLKKAFLQVVIDPKDRKFIRFLWRDKDGNIKKFQMVVLPFGVVSSPAILTQIVESIINDLSPVFRKVFDRCAYMDDLIIGSDNKSGLLSCINEAKIKFQNCGF